MDFTPPGWCVSGPGNARKSPWSLALIVTDNQSEGRRGGLYPARVVCIWAWQRSKSPWSLALTVTDNQSEGRRGGLYPARVMCPWACQRSKSPWSLALILTDNQSEGRWGGIYPSRMVCIWAWQRSKSPWSLTKKIPVFCWNPQDFHFSINYSFSDSLRPSWPQSLFSVEFLLNGKLIEQL